MTSARLSPRSQSNAYKQKHVLIVEDSKLVLQILAHVASQQLSDYVVHFATSLKEGCAIYEKHKDKIFASIVDLNLPDAPNGEMANYLLANDTPIIVLTGNYSDENRNRLLQLGVVDYVTKENRYSYEHAIGLIKRLEMNLAINVLVVEDSPVQQGYIKTLLEQHMYNVFTANNGAEALKVLDDTDDIKLVITDYNMPIMDGFELTKTLRRKYSKSELIIIGLSGIENKTLSAQFIKNGANDFLTKPFIQEEFHCRVTHNIENQEHLDQIKNWAFRDALTNLNNRRYLFDQGTELHKSAKANDSLLSVAVIDIDHFKVINDKHGHDAGDNVLIGIAAIFKEHFAPYTPIRMGGEEFCIIMPGLNNKEAAKLAEEARKIIEISVFGAPQNPIPVCISAGVISKLGESLDYQINAADKLLYQAKQNGRNQVVHE